MEDKLTTEYRLFITERKSGLCSKIDPLGQCTPTDCMTCKNAKVKIIREDGTVMRDDTDLNAGYEENYNYIKYKWKRNPCGFLEEFFSIKLSWLDRFVLKIKKYH